MSVVGMFILSDHPVVTEKEIGGVTFKFSDSNLPLPLIKGL